MANPNSLPQPDHLHERILLKSTIRRTLDFTILFLLLSLIAYRIVSLKNHGTTWLVALACESWFTFIWVLTICTQWNMTKIKTYPERLLERVHELPPVDMFVTTADPVLEPPIIIVNTVLSLLAVDYPENKLACYVSDDACSPLTFYSLVKASKFAKLWVPFCKKYDVHVRAPFRYFSGKPVEYSGEHSSEFQQEWEKMKEEYDKLSRKIEEAVQKSTPCALTGEFDVFSNIEPNNHPSIIKVLLENKEGLSQGILPHLVYISREKRPKQPHHYKAGAMNVLARVSGVMTNAPFMLNVDCDMFVNNPQVILHAMCSLLGVKNERENAFAQFPQIFYDGFKDDPFGNQLVVLQNFIGHGMVGIQGPLYEGTGCFHRRKVIYGASPDDQDQDIKAEGQGKFSDDGRENKFGKSVELTKSAAQILSGLNEKTDCPHDLLTFINTAYQVADCGYEYGTNWGTKVGWVYGSTTEDALTGMKIHGRGWKSIYCTPDPPGFLGCAPSGGPATMTQQKRWATGLLEVLFSRHSPFIATLTGKLMFRQCLAYYWLLVWGLRSIPELCYATLPAYCLLSNSNFLPKIEEPAMLIPIALFLIYYIYTLSEYIEAGLSIRSWWNNQRMGRIISASAWTYGLLSTILKLLGLSETVFEITQKDQSSDNNGDDHIDNIDAGRFTFDASPAFIPVTTIVLVHLAGLFIGPFGFKLPSSYGGLGFGEVLCSVWVVLMFSPFVKGLFGRGKYGIPSSTILKSMALALVFLHLCLRS